MSERGSGVDPTQSVLLQGKLAKEGRTEAKRMDGRADVVAESWLGKFHGPGSASYRRLAFDDLH
jgi:hypothetical protein